ncbi:hypothetical protein THAOC_26923 [Thalassiosira oceanica]|uniref:Uncharacterized protein n=1 Tax=Thalassiosira oceanica TaxID=159749 RepID=K0S3Z8_THAOC|nr:hypothetical protein THAOC_26923 [Thalassiosira oceanica]|eukprot:EJK53607.1 hypothetical protein THAOC_26923 [Thalassiosira oceanica]
MALSTSIHLHWGHMFSAAGRSVVVGGGVFTVRCFRKRFSTGASAIEMYGLAMEALRKASDARRDEEDRRQKEQIEAIERQREKSMRRTGNGHRLQRPRDETAQPKDRAAGIAMVKKIVQQTRHPGYVEVEEHTKTRKSSDVDETIPPSDSQSEDAWLAIARERMEEAALRQGHPLALVRLGNLALEKMSTGESSESKAKPLVDLEKCSKWEEDSPLDLSVLVNLLHGKDSGSRDVALYMYENAGERGSAEGWFNLGHLLWEAPDGKERSLTAFHRAMDLGDPDATYFLAAQYLASDEVGGEEGETLSATFHRSSRPSEVDGISLPSFAECHDELRQYGYRLLHQAANRHNHGPALHHLALLHYQHNDDEAEFARLLAAACRSGNAESLFVRGHSHYTGADGHPLDPAAALDDFLGAAGGGHADAMVSAGAILHGGVREKDGTVVVARDQPRAFQLYQEAGEAGSKEGWRNVVSCYASGEGVPKCVQTAKYIAKTMLGFEDR